MTVRARKTSEEIRVTPYLIVVAKIKYGVTLILLISQQRAGPLPAPYMER